MHEASILEVLCLIDEKLESLLKLQRGQKEGKKGDRKNIRGVFWGASPSDVKKSEKWGQTRSIDSRYLYYKGIIRGRECALSYYFGNDNADELTKIEYYFRVTDKTEDAMKSKTVELQDWLEKVLIENYGDKAENYSDPTWVIHDEETVIELKQRHGSYGGEYSVGVIMSQNPDYIYERKTDHYKQALEEI